MVASTDAARPLELRTSSRLLLLHIKIVKLQGTGFKLLPNLFLILEVSQYYKLFFWDDSSKASH